LEVVAGERHFWEKDEIEARGGVVFGEDKGGLREVVRLVCEARVVLAEKGCEFSGGLLH
jgi:hypothetical protein